MGEHTLTALKTVLSGLNQSEKKHARFKHCHPFIYTENHKYNNEKQRNTGKNTRTPQKGHINKLTHKHNNLQERRSDAVRIQIHRRKMQQNTINKKRNQRKTTKWQPDAKNMHCRKKRHSRYMQSRKNTDRTKNSIERMP